MAETKKAKALDPGQVRKAFASLDNRLKELEERVTAWHETAVEAEQRLEYIKHVQAKIDRYSRQLDDLLPHMTAAEAQMGRCNANHEKLWALIGQNAHGLIALRKLLGENEVVEDALRGGPSRDPEGGDDSGGD